MVRTVSASVSSRCDADERMTSWVSLSLGVFGFGMMPSVGDRQLAPPPPRPRHSPHGSGVRRALALRLSPRLRPPGTHSNARFASEGQSFLRNIAKILAFAL